MTSPTDSDPNNSVSSALVFLSDKINPSILVQSNFIVHTPLLLTGSDFRILQTTSYNVCILCLSFLLGDRL